MAADAYVPGHSHDIFVSYAWVDDRTPGAAPSTQGWVHALADNLRTLLAMQLGREAWGDIWIDRRIDPTQTIGAEVGQALAGSALLVVVLSEGWLESPWCRQELDRFVELAGRSGPGAAPIEGRIFVAHRTRIEPGRRPLPLRDLIGYDFYHTNRDGHERLLGFPVAQADNPADRDYFDRLDDLSRDLGRRLKELRAASGAAPPRAPIPAALAALAHTTLACAPTAPTASPPKTPRAIYLAECTPDLRRYRDLLCRQLDQSGLPTRPGRALPASPQDYREAARAELAESLLFVQLLGPYTLDKRPDLPQGYESLQLELAEGAGLPILRWMDPQVDPDQMDDPELFARCEVAVGAFDDFKRRVEREAQRLLIPPPVATDNDTQVLIRAADSDEDAACELGDQLLGQGVGYEVADSADPLGDLFRRAPYQGLVVVYDRCDRDWARKQVNECRVIAMAGKDKAPPCAVYDTEREGKRRLGMAVPRFYWLSKPSDPELGRYLQAITGASRP